jgi:hypothetical protein
MNQKKELINKIIDSINNDCGDWYFTDFRFCNRVTGIDIWTYNETVDGLSIMAPVKLEIGFFDKRKLNRAILDWKRNKVLLALNNKTK